MFELNSGVVLRLEISVIPPPPSGRIVHSPGAPGGFLMPTANNRLTADERFDVRTGLRNVG